MHMREMFTYEKFSCHFWPYWKYYRILGIPDVCFCKLKDSKVWLSSLPYCYVHYSAVMYRSVVEPRVRRSQRIGKYLRNFQETFLEGFNSDVHIGNRRTGRRERTLRSQISQPVFGIYIVNFQRTRKQIQFIIVAGFSPTLGPVGLRVAISLSFLSLNIYLSSLFSSTWPALRLTTQIWGLFSLREASQR